MLKRTIGYIDRNGDEKVEEQRFKINLPDPVAETNRSLVDLIAKARKEALVRNIEVNSVIINENMVEVPETWYHDGFATRGLSPMICGLHAYFTKDELPDEYTFAVLKGPEYEDRLKAFESIGMEPDELKKAADFYRRVKGEFVND